LIRSISSKWRAAIALFIVVLLSCNLYAADRVHLKLDDGSSRRYSGTIVEYNAKTLGLDSAGGRTNLPARNVTKIETTVAPSLPSARDALQAGKFADAERLLLDSAREEKRRWMQREILAEVVRAQVAQQKYVEAANTFSVIYRDEPDTRFIDRLPLHWWPRELTATEKTQAERLLAEDSAAAKLIGASWLLAGPNRASATAALTELVRSQTGSLKKLAQWQLWRSQIAGAAASQITAWEEELLDNDANLSAGAWLLIGRAKSNAGNHHAAATDFLRAAILANGHEDTAAMGLLWAAREMDRLEQPADAARLRQELKANFAGTEAATRVDQGATIVP
jgi:hypothetical protein